MKKKHIAVTGPTSAVGSNFIKYIQGQYEIVTIGRRKSDIIYDFVKDEVLSLPSGLDAIVHFAGVLHSKSDSDVLNMVKTNVDGLLKVCMAAKIYEIKQIIHISSISTILKPDSPYYSFYSLTKKQGVELAELYCKENGLNLCIIRPSQIFGRDKAYGRTQPLLYLMFKNAKSGKDINLYGTHDALRNYIYSDNLFSLLTAVIERRATGIIDAIDVTNYRLSEAAHMIIEAYGSKSKIQFMENKPNMEDNGFSTDKDYFKGWGIPFIGFKDAVSLIVDHPY